LQGTILAIRANSGRRVAVLEVAGEQACARCAAGKGCGAGIVSSANGLQLIDVPLSDTDNLHEGQTVALKLQGGSLLRAASIVYGWPLLGALLGAAAGLSRSEATAALMALSGLFAGWLLARWQLRRGRCLQRLLPVISP
jgi:positive regulator of sigma E activity